MKNPVIIEFLDKKGNYYDLQRCYSSSIFCSACGRYHCCFDISSIPQSVTDLQCCCSFSINYRACCRYHSPGSCCTSAATASTFYASGRFDKDSARSCTGIVKWLNHYWISAHVIAYLSSGLFWCLILMLSLFA